MQLKREELLKAYKVMNTIIDFEEKAIKEVETKEENQNIVLE